jgi:gas vesicle protein
MKQGKLAGLALSAALALFGCDRKSDVDHEINDLKEAERNSPQKAQELEKQLDQAKGEVVSLEQKLALAKQGVTDEVVEERAELQRALKDRDKHVQNEIAEAQGEAKQLNNETQKAQAELKRIPEGNRAETQLNTETKVIPSGRQVEVETQQQQVEVPQQQVVERPSTAQPPTTTRTTTTSKPMQTP